MDYKDIILERKDGVATLTLNRPEKLNAVSNRMMSNELPDAFDIIERDDDIKVLILTGAGDRAFCTGADVSERLATRLAGQKIETTRWETIQPVGWIGTPLYRLRKPAIAAVNGIAAGAGAALPMLCDIRIASENARFSFVFVKRGIIPDCGSTYLLPRIVGTAKAIELMWSGEIIDAKEAERVGLVNKVVPQDKLMSEAMDYALRLAHGPSVAIEMIKWSTRASWSNNFEQQLEFESRAQRLCMSTEDFEEGYKSFVEKREPHFKGK